VAKEIGIEDDFIFIEKASGKDFKRPEYQLMKRMFREDDILYIKSLNKERSIEVIAHELLHLKQYKDNRITIKDSIIY